MAFLPKKPGQDVPMPSAMQAMSADPSNPSAANGAQNGGGAAGSADGKIPEELKAQVRAASQQANAVFGQVVSILMRSRPYVHMSLGDLEWVVLPALILGQFSIAQAQSNADGRVVPAGIVWWARVSSAVDQRLSSNPDALPRLGNDEWKCGDIIWVVDAVGDAKVVQAMLQQLAVGQWQGSTIRMRGRDKDGKYRVGQVSSK